MNSKEARIKAFNDTKGNFSGWGIYCPGCKINHIFDKRWNFNGDMRNPTFTPSMLVRYTWGKEKKECRCHSYITNGIWLFLDDCLHDLKGKHVELEEIKKV